MYRNFLIAFFFIAPLLNCSAQISFGSSDLKNLFDLLPEPVKKNIFDLKNKNAQIDTLIAWDGRLLSVSLNNNTLTKLGFQLKESQFFNKNDSIVLTFIQRALLRLSLEKSVTDVVKTAETMQIRILFQDFVWNYNDLLFTPVHSFNELIDSINASTQFFLSKDKFFFIAEWKNNDYNFKMIFPNNYQLLVGKNKKELDNELCFELYGTDINKSFIDSTEAMKTPGDSLPILASKGSTFMDRLSSDVFFKWNGKDSLLVFEEGLINLSLHNLFLKKELAGNRILHINQKLYGGRSFTYSLILQNFIKYFENDFQVYVGMENNNPDLIEGTVVFSHKYFKFVHLLHFKTNSSEIFNNTGKIKADFYTNIPMHNVSNLFKEYKPEENKRKIDVIILKP